jgi:hypothetical protein
MCDCVEYETFLSVPPLNLVRCFPFCKIEPVHANCCDEDGKFGINSDLHGTYNSNFPVNFTHFPAL